MLLSLLLSLLPEKNVLCGWISGFIVVAIAHGLVVLNVSLTPEQSTAMGASAAIFVAHVWDTIAKLIAQSKPK